MSASCRPWLERTVISAGKITSVFCSPNQSGATFWVPIALFRSPCLTANLGPVFIPESSELLATVSDS